MSIRMDKFSKFLTAQMKEHDWSQADLARASGLSRQVISYYLGNKSKTPDINAIKSLARALRLPVETVLRAAEFLPPTVDDPWLEKINHKIQNVEKGKRQTLEKLIRLQKELWRYLLSRSFHDPLFMSVRNQRLTTDSIKHLLDRIGKRADIHVHPHKFRHTFAIQFLRNGGDIFTLQRLLGHSTWAMCKRYLALAKMDLESAHRRASPVDNLKL